MAKKQLIVVAVECNHVGDGRLREYSPFSYVNSTLGRITGKGKIYMDWLVNTLKPQIDAKYRTLSDREHTIICGSSMGGLMSLYAVTQYLHEMFPWVKFFSGQLVCLPVFGFRLEKLWSLWQKRRLKTIPVSTWITAAWKSTIMHPMPKH